MFWPKSNVKFQRKGWWGLTACSSPTNFEPCHLYCSMDCSAFAKLHSLLVTVSTTLRVCATWHILVFKEIMYPHTPPSPTYALIPSTKVTHLGLQQTSRPTMQYSRDHGRPWKDTARLIPGQIHQPGTPENEKGRSIVYRTYRPLTRRFSPHRAVNTLGLL